MAISSRTTSRSRSRSAKRGQSSMSTRTSIAFVEMVVEEPAVDDDVLPGGGCVQLPSQGVEDLGDLFGRVLREPLNRRCSMKCVVPASSGELVARADGDPEAQTHRTEMGELLGDQPLSVREMFEPVRLGIAVYSSPTRPVFSSRSEADLLLAVLDLRRRALPTLHQVAALHDLFHRLDPALGHPACEMWTRPSVPGLRLTKAPKEVVDATRPIDDVARLDVLGDAA